MAVDSRLIQAITAALAGAQHAERAAAQQAYMKSEMPYFGITTPQLRRLLKPHLATYSPGSRADWQDTVGHLWDHATHRELRYAATGLAAHEAAARWRDPESMDLWRHLIITGAWWDHVDAIASTLVGEVLANYRPQTTGLLRDWAHDEDQWIRRTAVLSQLKHKQSTDVDLLAHAIDANAADPSFWLRKAIGWALREYAKTDAAWVRAYVGSHDLSPLSRREALKHVGAADS